MQHLPIFIYLHQFFLFLSIFLELYLSSSIFIYLYLSSSIFGWFQIHSSLTQQFANVHGVHFIFLHCVKDKELPQQREARPPHESGLIRSSAFPCTKANFVLKERSQATHKQPTSSPCRFRRVKDTGFGTRNGNWHHCNGI